VDARGADAASNGTPGVAGRANLTAQAASGLSWSALSTVALVVANLAYTATVSRLLEPTEFGLMAMANLVVLFGQFFARMGLASALVQKTELSDDEVRAASTAGIVLGLMCMGLVWLLAPAVGGLFHTPEVAPVLRGLGVSFLFMGWSMTGLGLLRREMRFRALSVISIGAYVVGYLVVGVGLALLGAGVWSLAAPTTTSTLVQSVWQFGVPRHPLRPVLRWRPYQTVCGYGSRWAPTGVHSFALLAAEVTAGAFALTLCIGVCPAPAMASAGLVGPPNGRRRRAALLVLIPPDRAVIEVRW
jgi:lipopolysaccharide exporter